MSEPISRLRLYLIRHGEVEAAEAGQVLGWMDAPLSDHGRTQAQKVAEALAEVKLFAVCASDLNRSVDTADAVSKRQELVTKVDPVWREINMGQWDGRTIASLHEEFPDLVSHLFEDPDSFGYPDGESFASFISRVQGGLDVLLKEHENGDVALITHGGVCRALIGGALGIPARNWLRIAQDYGCLNVVEWVNGNPTVHLLNYDCDADRFNLHRN